MCRGAYRGDTETGSTLAKDNPELHFLQGLAEDTGFGDERFDGLAVCFLLHEMPPRYVSKALAEFRRILKPGGVLAVCEPSPEQFAKSNWALLREHGIRGLYFGLMARLVFEPFVDAWHQTAGKQLFVDHGFECVNDELKMPVRHFVLRKAV